LIEHLHARERAASMGLDQRVEIRQRDYREISGEAHFDKMVSVGMYRHVGIAKVRLEILDVEDIRPHCPMTLPHCVRRLEAAREEAIAAAGEDRYWIWRSYMPAWLAPGPRPAKVYQARLRRLPQRG
jgi:cyclopropane fatty-acyl-phospholipid synthase-like methyltransferase